MRDDFHRACRAIIAGYANPYARAYATAGLAMMGNEAIRVQALYILGNLNGWRGDVARATKRDLRRIAGLPNRRG